MWQTNCGNGIAEIGRKKKLWEPNCGNAIAEIGEQKKNLAIVAMALLKMGVGGKSYEIYERVKKKVVMSIIFL